jgi:hypothetical protein
MAPSCCTCVPFACMTIIELNASAPSKKARSNLKLRAKAARCRNGATEEQEANDQARKDRTVISHRNSWRWNRSVPPCTSYARAHWMTNAACKPVAHERRAFYVLGCREQFKQRQSIFCAPACGSRCGRHSALQVTHRTTSGSRVTNSSPKRASCCGLTCNDFLRMRFPSYPGREGKKHTLGPPRAGRIHAKAGCTSEVQPACLLALYSLARLAAYGVPPAGGGVFLLKRNAPSMMPGAS